MPDAILAGVKVLEYSELVAGPYCGKLLADLGAEVVKIENPGLGDAARCRPPFRGDVPDPECSLLFFYLNANKSGITLDPSKPDGRALFRELVKNTDILIEDRAPRYIKAESLDYDSLSEISPRLVMTSITPFGQTGPYSDYKAYPLNTFQSGGIGYLMPGSTPFPEREPINMGRYAGEYFSGVVAAGATMVALYRQWATGLGQHVDISKQEALLVGESWDIVRWPNEALLVTRATRGYLFGGVIPCKDGYVQVVFNRWPDEWLALLDLVGHPDWAADERLRDRKYCDDHAREIKERLASAIKDRTKEELFRQAIAKRCPLAPVYGVDEIANSAQMQTRGFFVDVPHGDWGALKYPSAPYRFSKTPWSFRKGAPRLGEDNEEVYCQRLGLSGDRMAALRTQGVI